MNPELYTETDQQEPWEWIPCEGGVCITGYSGADEEMILPETINGMPVVKIASEAFAYGTFRSVTLPSSLKIIGSRAFAFCLSLEELLLPEGLTELDGSAVICTEIQKLRLPSGLQTILSPESLDMRVYADASHSFFLADGSGLYQKTENGGLTLLSLFTEEEADYELLPGTEAVAAGAFCNVHAPISLTFPESLAEIDRRAWNPLFTKNGAGKLTSIHIHPNNSVFFSNENGIWKKTDAGLELLRWTGNDCVDLPDAVKVLETYSLAERKYSRLALSSGCVVETGVFKGASVQLLCIRYGQTEGKGTSAISAEAEGQEEIVLPEGQVENNTLLTAIFSSGTADFSSYDEMLITGYLTPERIRMCLARLQSRYLSADRKEALLNRLLAEGAQVAELLVKEADVNCFAQWLDLSGQDTKTLLPAMEMLLAYRGKEQAAAREMLAALQTKRSGMEEADEFAL